MVEHESPQEKPFASRQGKAFVAITFKITYVMQVFYMNR